MITAKDELVWCLAYWNTLGVLKHPRSNWLSYTVDRYRSSVVTPDFKFWD